MMSENRLLTAALWYAQEFTLPVFPCRVHGKTPATKHGFKDAVTDGAQIEDWWSQTPYNVGIATGGGVLVLDVDCHEGGDDGAETLRELERKHGELPETWTVLTPTGGVHYYFAYHGDDLSIGAAFQPGLDFRYQGGYVIAPPSIHPNGGEYTWDAGRNPANTTLADLPDWLRDKMKNGRKDKPTPKVENGSGIEQGRRNDALFRLASSLRAKGLSESAIFAAVSEENRTRCVPPLDESEVRRIAQCALRYPPSVPKSGDGTICKPPDFSDAGNAEIFVALYGADLIYTDGMGWLYWNGTFWECNEHKALELATDFSKKMLEEARAADYEAHVALAGLDNGKAAGDSPDPEKLEAAKATAKAATAYLNHAKLTRRAARIKGLLELSQPRLVKLSETFDADPFKLNTPGGLLNLIDGQITPHDRTHFCTKITAAGCDSKGAEIWEAFLNVVTCADNSVKGFLQGIAGMSLFGRVFDERAIFATGIGGNGKSAFFNVLATILGNYAGSIDADILTSRRNNSGAQLATLRGKRLIIAGELEEGRRLSTAMLKRITSTDVIRVEEKYHAPFDIVPSHSLVLYTNFLPRVGSTDKGTWRRILVVPFRATFSEKEKITNYGQTLAEQAGGAILA